MSDKKNTSNSGFQSAKEILQEKAERLQAEADKQREKAERLERQAEVIRNSTNKR